jgi:hypothetical protein
VARPDGRHSRVRHLGGEADRHDRVQAARPPRRSAGPAAARSAWPWTRWRWRSSPAKTRSITGLFIIPTGACRADSSNRRNSSIWRCVWDGQEGGQQPRREGRRCGRWLPGRGSQRFWAAVARGLSSEDAGVVAGVSPPVGVRWFRQARTVPIPGPSGDPVPLPNPSRRLTCGSSGRPSDSHLGCAECAQRPRAKSSAAPDYRNIYVSPRASAIAASSTDQSVRVCPQRRSAEPCGIHRGWPRRGLAIANAPAAAGVPNAVRVMVTAGSSVLRVSRPGVASWVRQRSPAVSRPEGSGRGVPLAERACYCSPAAPQTAMLAMASFERTSTSGALRSCGWGIAARANSAIAPGRKTRQ